MQKPIRVFYSTLSQRFYASNAYKEERPGIVTITGKKFDVTQDIARLIVENEIIAFTSQPEVPPGSSALPPEQNWQKGLHG
jgi:hypothetical protein